MSEALIETLHLSKQFGALQATDDVSLAVRRGEVHALIGPNGAGKTTLIGQITGELRPDSGRVRFAGRDITTLATADRARLGLARSFQITSIFNSFTAEGNVALSVQARDRHSFRFWRPAARIERLREPARRMLRDIGLAERRDVVAGGMSHGEHRQLELAMALATEPALLLLDEPMAGLGSEESQAMMQLLRRLKGQYTMLIVEHDMDVVFSLADRISVLVAGRLIASGGAEAIRADPEVRTAYLGEEEDLGRLMLKVEGLQTSYGQSQVLFDVGFEVRRGEVVTLIGRNGMGKTTTVRSVMGMTPPHGGSISLDGKEIRGLAPYRIARLGLGLVPEGRGIFTTLTVRENLTATAAARNGARRWTIATVAELFPWLEERRDQMGAHLSGGEQQMLAIARALMTNPELLILDEATEGLAPLVRLEIWRVLRRLKAGGQSILLIDKNLKALTRLADRHYVIERGRVRWSGDSKALLAEYGKIRGYVGL